MNNLTRTAMRLLICSQALVHCGLAADDNLQIRVLKGWTAPDSTHAGDWHRELQKQIAEGTFDPLADSVLRGAETLTNTIFNFGSLKLIKAVTYTDAGGDALVAEWESDSGRANLVLQDTAYFSEYDIRTGPRVIHNAPELSAFLADILVPEKEPLHLQIREFEVHVPPQPPAIVFFQGSNFRSAVHVVADIDIGGATDGKAWYLRVRLPKTYTRLFYPVPPYIPERFPPLSELMKTWSFERIYSEVGKRSGPEVFSVHRDGVLLAELARRGLSDSQIGDLLAGVSVGELGERAQLLLWAITKAGKEALVNRHLKLAIERYRPIGPAAEDAVEAFFRVAARNCSPESETFAVEALKDRTFFLGPLNYLSQCSASSEVFQMVSLLPVPERATQYKESTLFDMRRRLARIGK